MVAYEWDYEVLTSTWAVLGTQKYLVLHNLNVYLSSAMLYDVGYNCKLYPLLNTNVVIYYYYSKNISKPTSGLVTTKIYMYILVTAGSDAGLVLEAANFLAPSQATHIIFFYENLDMGILRHHVYAPSTKY